MKSKLKRGLLVLLTLALMASVLVACGKKTETETKPETKEEKKELKVVLLITSNLGDKGFYDSANDGMKLLESELGATTKTIEMGQDPSKYEPYIRDVSEQDWDYIVMGSSPLVEAAQLLVPEYPDKKYIMFDVSVDWAAGDFNNVYCVEYKQNEGSYIAGAVAAIMTSKGELANPDKVIGTVGGSDLPIINDFMIGYIRGAQRIEPDIKIAISYAGTFIDSTKGKELALAQIDQAKADVIFQIASQTGIGVLDACAEKGVYSIGVDGDQEAAFKENDPEMAGNIVTSMMKKVDQSILRAVKLAEEGTLPWGTTERIGVKENGVGIVYSNNFKSMLSEDDQKLIKDIEEEIVSGAIEVESAMGMSSEDFAKIRESVKP